MVAYQPGNAANMAAPATISQTSLPSHSGPIVLMAARRPASSLPTAPCSMPTPKSKPSRTKKPVHRTAMRMNQNGTSFIVTSILDGWHGRADIGLGAGRRELLTCVLQHQHQVDGREHAVQQDEDNQADHDGSGADRRRDAVFRQHDALHDPGLAKNGISPSVSTTSIVISLVILVLLYGVLATVDLMLMLKYAREQLPPARAETDVGAPVPAVQY